MIDYEQTVYITLSIFPCEWFLYRHTQRWLDGTTVDRWQVGPLVIERSVEGVRRDSR